MQAASKTLIGLETRFWQSMVDNDAKVARSTCSPSRR